MAVILVTFCNKKYYKSALLLKNSALSHGVDKVVIRTHKWLKSQTKFYQKNKHILTQRRGAGFWLWKPYVLLQSLQEMDNDDVLIYLDAGCAIIEDLESIVSLCRKEKLLLFFNNNNFNKIWTKRDCFHYMNCDSELFHNQSQLLAGYIFCTKTEENISLFQEWLHFAEDERILSDQENVCGLSNIEGFKDHRHDQSILTNLSIKYNLELFRDPSQWGNKYKIDEHKVQGEFVEGDYVEQPMTNSNYPTVINGHRLQFKLSLKNYLNYQFGRYVFKKH